MNKTMVKRLGLGMALVMLVALCVASSGCIDSKAKSSDEETIGALKIGLIPTEDQIEMLKKFGPVQEYLETELGMKVETFTATDLYVGY